MVLEIAVGDVVLALALPEVHAVDTGVVDKAVHRTHEVLRHRVHQRRGHERLAPMIAEEVGDAVGEHELGHVQVQVHAVDALQFPHDVVGENVSGTAG